MFKICEQVCDILLTILAISFVLVYLLILLVTVIHETFTWYIAKFIHDSLLTIFAINFSQTKKKILYSCACRIIRLIFI